MNIALSTLKLVTLILGLNFSFVIHSQTEKVNSFLEIHSGVMHYETPWNKLFVNPVFGVVLNASVSRHASVELYYSTAWIKEDIRHYSQGSEYYYVREQGLEHWVGFRLGFGEETPDYSLRGLVGVSMGNHVGLELGARYTKSLSDQLSLNASFIGKAYPLVDFEDRSQGYIEPMATALLLNFQIGVGYHF